VDGRLLGLEHFYRRAVITRRCAIAEHAVAFLPARVQTSIKEVLAIGRQNIEFRGDDRKAFLESLDRFEKVGFLHFGVHGASLDKNLYRKTGSISIAARRARRIRMRFGWQAIMNKCSF
jgi:hypothetical protein